MEENLEWQSSSIKAPWWEWAGAAVFGTYITVAEDAMFLEGLLWKGKLYVVSLRE